MSDILHSVLYAASVGLFVFPLDPGTKLPFTVHGGRRMKWSAAATRDERTIRQWWSVCPDANYGVAAKPSGLLIIDCDTGKGTPAPASHAGPGVGCGEDLFVSISYKLAGYFPLETLTVGTPSGGSHWYYWNRSGRKMTQASLYADWIDVRSNGGSEGGYVVGPGSVVGGKRYRPFMLGRGGILDAPEWLLDLCAEPARAVKTAAFQGRFGQPESPVEGVLRTVRTAAAGNQGQALYWAAMTLHDEGYSQHEAASMLAANLPPDSDPHDPWTERHVETTVRSAYR